MQEVLCDTFGNIWTALRVLKYLQVPLKKEGIRADTWIVDQQRLIMGAPLREGEGHLLLKACLIVVGLCHQNEPLD
jgi:hypothetical protein